MPRSTNTDKDPSSQFSAESVNIQNDGNIINATNSNLTFNTVNGNTQAQTEALKVLQSHTAEAGHTSIAVSRQDICTPGTRTTTLSKLESLATSSGPSSPDPDVIWMHGPAGAGKSVIMRTFANMLEKQGLLLGSFFFSRFDPQRNTSRRFIPTLAAQVWAALPATRENITGAIQNTPDLFSRPAHRQSPFLLEKPLLAGLASADTPLVIIVDGLDECTEVAGRIEIVKAMVQLASNIRGRTNIRVKIFIASRPEHEIQSTFDKLTSKAPISVIRLDDSDANIHLFYEEQFRKIREKFSLPSSWPSQEEIKWLMGKTSGRYSFPFASVSTGFMYDDDPEHRLKIIQEALKDDKQPPSETLDQLYATIFAQLPENMRRTAVSVLRCRHHPWWTLELNTTLELFLQLPRGYINTLRPYLASLINFDHNMEPYHASLVDFLVNPSRSGKFSLYIDDAALSHAIQRGLLTMLTSGQPAMPGCFVDESEEARAFGLFFDWHGQGRFMAQMASLYPLPRAELSSALKRINVPFLSVTLSKGLMSFLQMVRKQFQSHFLWISNPGLWYTIWYGLPHQIKQNQTLNANS